MSFVNKFIYTNEGQQLRKEYLFTKKKIECIKINDTNYKCCFLDEVCVSDFKNEYKIIKTEFCASGNTEEMSKLKLHNKFVASKN